MKKDILVPYVDTPRSPKKKKHAPSVNAICDLTHLIEQMYADNIRLTAENTRLIEQAKPLRDSDGFIVLVPMSSKERENG